MNAENLNFERTASVGSVTELKRQFPHLPPRILVTLAVMTFLARTVTPFRLCQCGCGESVHGKARLHSEACRQRVSRERRADRALSPKQFNIVLQFELPVPIPAVPAPSMIPRSEISERVSGFCDACGKESSDLKIVNCAPVAGALICPACCSPATRASNTSQPHEPATRARAFPRTVTAY